MRILRRQPHLWRNQRSKPTEKKAFCSSPGLWCYTHMRERSLGLVCAGGGGARWAGGARAQPTSWTGSQEGGALSNTVGVGEGWC